MPWSTFPYDNVSHRHVYEELHSSGGVFSLLFPRIQLVGYYKPTGDQTAEIIYSFQTVAKWFSNATLALLLCIWESQ